MQNDLSVCHVLTKRNSPETACALPTELDHAQDNATDSTYSVPQVHSKV